MPMVSYAQNFEDVILERAFKNQRDGFYIDVGASHPILDSVTRHFYERGWHGINIEPDPQYFALQARYRPRDISLNVALSDREETLTLYLIEGFPALSTLDLDNARRQASAGLKVGETEVQVTTLAQICDTYRRDGQIDFLKIDVESWELQVIKGGNWTMYRPRVVLVEATVPNTREPAWRSWDPLLLEHQYRFVYFDGLNRFYVREEDMGLIEHFALPPNVFDDFVFHKVVERSQQLQVIGQELQETRQDLEATRQDLEATRQDLEATRQDLEATRQQLERTHQSKSWRYTSGLRAISRRLRQSKISSAIY